MYLTKMILHPRDPHHNWFRLLRHRHNIHHHHHRLLRIEANYKSCLPNLNFLILPGVNLLQLRHHLQLNRRHHRRRHGIRFLRFLRLHHH